MEQQVSKLGEQGRRVASTRADLAEAAEEQLAVVPASTPMTGRGGADHRGQPAPAGQGGRLPDPQGGHQGRHTAA